MTSSTLERFQEFRTFDPTILGFQNSRISLKINGGERGFERSILGSEPDPPKLIESSQLVELLRAVRGRLLRFIEAGGFARRLDSVPRKQQIWSLQTAR